MMKKCSTCKIEKNISNFTKDKRKKDGLKINCIECCKVLYNNYREKNYQKESERGKKYNKEKRVINKEETKIYKKEYFQKNKDKIRNKKREYRNINKEVLNDKRKKNIKYLNTIIGTSIRASLKKLNSHKKSRTYEILGCSIIEFKLYIESKFEPWMNWENYGKYNGELNYGWDIDHIIPISFAKTEEDVLRLNHYSNLQPLCSYINRFIKRDKYDNICN
jgi:hypothetical protein